MIIIVNSIPLLSKKTKIITDINPVIPFTVAAGCEEYPSLDEVFKEIKSRANLYKIDALEIARDSGSIITKNIVMLGALAAIEILPFKYNILLDTILDNVPKKYRMINEKAFRGGIDSIQSL